MEAVRGLIERLIGEKSSQIKTEWIADAGGFNCYEIDGTSGVVTIRGDCGVSIANGLYQYLKEYCGVHLSWCGSQMHLPEQLPVPHKMIRHVIPQTYRAIYNYCTFGYSMAFWDWERWEKEIDFLALNGINMPLAIVGTEAVWYDALKAIGFSSEDALRFLSSPAYYPWQAMTNFEGVLPLHSEDFVRRRLELGKKIIDRQVALGMHPVQQGFSGFVPRGFIKKFPKAKITLTRKWSKFPKTAQLDPTDPLFHVFGTVFLEKQRDLLGDYGYYAADPFHESKPTVKGEAYLQAVGRAVNRLFFDFNPSSVWVMQSWSLRKGIVTAVPKERLLIFDLDGKIRLRHDDFWGYPFVLGRLDNFGQKTYFHGNIARTAENEFGALHADLPNLVGTGLFMEGSLSNPMYYEALFSVQTTKEPLQAESWIKDYCRRRYGRETANAVRANEILYHKVYVEPLHESGYSSVICALPLFDVQSSGQCDAMEKPYDPACIEEALSLMLADKEALGNQVCYQYDTADLTRQFASNQAIKLHKLLVQAYRKRDWAHYQQHKNAFLTLLRLLDSALESFDEMCFYKWLKDAHQIAQNKLEYAWLDESARALLTIWGPYRNSDIYDYAWREWAGLIRDFYLPRWELFFHKIEGKHGRWMLFIEKLLPRGAGKIKMRATPFYSMIADWTVNWIQHPVAEHRAVQKDPLEICEEIFLRYRDLPGSCQ